MRAILRISQSIQSVPIRNYSYRLILCGPARDFAYQAYLPSQPADLQKRPEYFTAHEWSGYCDLVGHKRGDEGSARSLAWYRRRNHVYGRIKVQAYVSYR